MVEKKNINPNLILDLGNQPVSNRFLKVKSPTLVPSFPMRLMQNRDDGLLFLEKPFPRKHLKPRFNWFTYFEPEDHLDDLVDRIIGLPGINNKSVFAGYSFKDISTLERFMKKGYNNQWVINPKKHLKVVDDCSGIETFQEKFSFKSVNAILKDNSRADVMIVRHVLEHANQIDIFIESMKKLIKKNGYIVWEIPDCERALNQGDCTTLWEEHTFYFTSFTFKCLLEKFGFKIIDYKSEHYHLENSIIAIVKIEQSSTKILPDKSMVSREIIRAENFEKLLIHKQNYIKKKLINFRENIGKIALFGAGHLSVTFLSIMKIVDLIEFVIDDNPHKNGMIMPIGGLDIVGSDYLHKSEIKLCLLGINPISQIKVIKNNNYFIDNGGMFASIFTGQSNSISKVL